MFTEHEKSILELVADFRNYDNLESELNDNAVGVYFRDIREYTPFQPQTANTFPKPNPKPHFAFQNQNQFQKQI